MRAYRLPSVLFVPSGTDRIAASRTRAYDYAAPLRARGIRCRVFPALSERLTTQMLTSPTMGAPRRVLYYASVMAEKLLRFVVVIALARRYDAVYLQRTTYPFGLVWALRAANRNLIFDFDDAIYMADPGSRERGVLGELKNRLKSSEVAAMVRSSRWAIAENHYLADYARLHCPSVSVIGGPVDTDRYPFIERKGGSPLVIGWIGSPSTAPFLRMVEPALRTLASERPILVKLVGAGPFRFSGIPAEYIEWSLAAELEALKTFDVGLMPMPDNEWTRGKLGYKMLQYMSVGAVSLVSRTTTTERAFSDGEQGYLIRDGDEWLIRLRALAGDPSLRGRIGRTARAHAEAAYSLKSATEELERILVSLVPEPSPIRVVAFLSGFPGVTPGQRFRIELWKRLLPNTRVSVTTLGFETRRFNSIRYDPGRMPEKALWMGFCIVRRLIQAAAGRASSDVVFIYREIQPLGPAVISRALRWSGARVVFDFDDAIYLGDVSDANRAFGFLKSPRKAFGICGISSHVTVGNNHLRSKALEFNPKVTVIPSSIDTALYRPPASRQRSPLPVVGWSGSQTTLPHLLTVIPALRRVKAQIPFELRLMGVRNLDIPGLEPVCVAWSPEREASEIASYDVGLMPLPDDEWSRGKCAMKAILYMALGVPVLASPVGVNAELVKDGTNGLLASTEEAWVEKLALLLTDGESRRRLAEEGRRTVEERFAGEAMAERFAQVIETVYAS